MRYFLLLMIAASFCWSGCAKQTSASSKDLKTFKKMFVGGTPATKEPVNQQGHIKYSYDSGESWGTSIDIWLSEHDFQGMNQFSFEIKSAASVNVGVYIAERGNALPTETFKVFADGSDGESYRFNGGKVIKADKEWKTHSMSLDMAKLGPNLYYGNQKGNKTMNLGGIESISFLVPGKQGKGLLEVRGMKFLKGSK
jgi:hypothetical protein